MKREEKIASRKGRKDAKEEEEDFGFLILDFELKRKRILPRAKGAKTQRRGKRILDF